MTTTDSPPTPPVEDLLALPREVFNRAKAAFCPVLLEHGITNVVIIYDGSGDEGQVNSIEAYDVLGKAMEIPEVSCERVQLTFARTIATDTTSLDEALDSFAEEALAVFHKDWEDGEGACGTITIDTARQTAEMEHLTRFISHGYDNQAL